MTDFKLIRWRSRRGMLELDLLLLPFVDSCYATLSAKAQANYQQLLTFPDPQIYAWLLGQTIPEEIEIKEIIDAIRQFHQSSL